MAQVNTSETPLDTKCGLIYNISEGLSVDALYDVKLALSAFDTRERNSNLQSADDILSKDSVERARFRLWTGTRSA
jgi:hypothetical protein